MLINIKHPSRKILSAICEPMKDSRAVPGYD